jgi:UDP-3-O-[3-hydroxymyristoyl] glucosamine N-acyltransferase
MAISKVLNIIKAEQRQLPWVAEPKVATDAVISPFAVVDQHVEIGSGVVIEPFCVVESDVSIGRKSILRSGVRVHSRVAIGDESVIGANTVIGHQGYGFVRDELGNKTRILHLGGVVIGSYVEIGALNTIPSGTIIPTIIEDYVKVDDHVHVGHNVRISRGASVTAAVVIGGSAVIDADAWIGINSSIRDGRHVGSHSLIGMDVSLQQDLAENCVARAPRPDVKKRPDEDDTAIGFTKR